MASDNDDDKDDDEDVNTEDVQVIEISTGEALKMLDRLVIIAISMIIFCYNKVYIIFRFKIFQVAAT